MQLQTLTLTLTPIPVTTKRTALMLQFSLLSELLMINDVPTSCRREIGEGRKWWMKLSNTPLMKMVTKILIRLTGSGIPWLSWVITALPLGNCICFAYLQVVSPEGKTT